MTQVVQILTANGYQPGEVLDNTPLWLCRIYIQGLAYKDMHLRMEQRTQRLLVAQPWSKTELDLEDFGTFPWEQTNEPEPIDVEQMRAQDSTVIEDIKRTLG